MSTTVGNGGGEGGRSIKLTKKMKQVNKQNKPTKAIVKNDIVITPHLCFFLYSSTLDQATSNVNSFMMEIPII